MVRDDGYEYITLHGHRRRVYHELTGVPMHFRDVWSVFGPDLSKGQIAVRVRPGDACRRSKLRLARIPYRNLSNDFVSVHGSDLLAAFEASGQDFGEDFVWLDAQMQVMDPALLRGHETSDYHHRDFHASDEFCERLGNTLIFYNHDDDMGEIYSAEEAVLSRLINYLVLNFVRNKTGTGYFKRAPTDVLRMLRRISLPGFSEDVSSVLMDLAFTDGITMHTEGLCRAGKTLTVLIHSGLPEFNWLPGHLKENGPRFQLAFDVSGQLWSLEKLD